MTAPASPAPADSKRPSKGAAVAICMVLIALGVVVWFNYYIKIKRDTEKGHLPIKNRVEKDPVAWVDQNGKSRRLEELKGKVIVWSYVYTTCPSGCAGIAQKMKELQDEFGSHPKFQLVSVSLYPEHDRPEVIKAWTDIQHFTGDNWWFLTTPTGAETEGDAVRKWMSQTFRVFAEKNSPEHIIKNPADVWTHKLVMVITDHKGQVRTPTENDSFWDPFHPSYEYSWFPRPIREDVEKLLKDAETAAP